MQQYYISFWLFIYVMDNLQDMLVYKRPLAVEYYTKTSRFNKIILHRIMIYFVHTTHDCRSCSLSRVDTTWVSLCLSVCLSLCLSVCLSLIYRKKILYVHEVLTHIV